MRGEHLAAGWSMVFTTGSSPHARGTPEPKAVAPESNGIIPACAGNTSHFFWCEHHGGDHPRMRGEHAGGI